MKYLFLITFSDKFECYVSRDQNPYEHIIRRQPCTLVNWKFISQKEFQSLKKSIGEKTMEVIDRHELRILANRIMEITEANRRMKVVADGLAMQDEKEAKDLALVVAESVLKINAATSNILGEMQKHLPKL